MLLFIYSFLNEDVMILQITKAPLNQYSLTAYYVPSFCTEK